MIVAHSHTSLHAQCPLTRRDPPAQSANEGNVYRCRAQGSFRNTKCPLCCCYQAKPPRSPSLRNSRCLPGVSSGASQRKWCPPGFLAGMHRHPLLRIPTKASQKLTLYSPLTGALRDNSKNVPGTFPVKLKTNPRIQGFPGQSASSGA